jgi:hypothetical protein
MAIIQYIGYLVTREPTTHIISDAAYKGIGGWSPEYSFKWRLNHDDLVYAGFDMKLLVDSFIEPSVVFSLCLPITLLPCRGYVMPCICIALTSVVLLASPPPFCLHRDFRAKYRADIYLDV